MRKAKMLGMAILLTALLALSGCSAAGNGEEEPPAEEEQIMSPVAATNPTDATKPSGSPAPAAAGTGTPAQPVNGSPVAGPANVDVAPAEAAVNNVVLALSFDNPRHMFEQTTTTASSAPNPDPAQNADADDKDEAVNTGSAVFPGGMLRVTGNFDAAQGPPADAPNAILRHVVLVAKTKDGGQVVPYQAVTIDVLLDGRPVIFDQALVPMVAVDREPRQVYYGNNVKFPQSGTYQVFVRMQRNPLLGEEAPPAAQFNVTVK